MTAAPDISIRNLTGEALAASLDALAELRIAVFRAFPYLYDGDRTYEQNYLRAYAASPDAIIVGAFDDDRLVGAATAAPMADHAAPFAGPFEARGYDISRIFYFGESVLLPEYRGHGIGHAFFDKREGRARELGFAQASFCAVIRPFDHAARPADYRPLDSFWRRRGFSPVDRLVGQFAWKDAGDDGESQHAMQFWMKTL
ncbi:GNAT family N-acetyltransferase [Rhizorhapis suberifaciens]|uniref:GNAT superfamily N-acetyltransferase n=1 Tax=Rhizorhapis suberifaciens TaxID=13656 RepID=A0A840HRS9_9SPHN|nr:GNAT family N-acetyltransferase [Rhizorhapis suberifaciens]MBB4640244.1 GNAT superfamily N-acetyltransferase [Rhizorhapis suberifaciens]